MNLLGHDGRARQDGKGHPPGIGHMVAALAADCVDDELRPIEKGLQQELVVAQAHEVPAMEKPCESLRDLVAAVADAQPVRPGAGDRLHDDRPLPVAVGPGQPRCGVGHLGLLRNEQAMAPGRLDHVELVAPCGQCLDPVGRQLHAMREPLGEAHAPFGNPRPLHAARWWRRTSPAAVNIAQVTQVAVVGPGVEAVGHGGGKLLGRLQVEALDVAFQELAYQLAAGRIAVDDDDASLLSLIM